MGAVIAGLAVFAVVIAVGWALVRFGAVPAGSDVVLTRVCFYAATPALLVLTIGRADLGTVLSSQSLAGLAAETLGVLSAGAVHRWVLHRSVADSTIGALAGGYVNAANLGIPVLIVLLGDATAIAPILLLQLLVLSPIAFGILDTATNGRSASRWGVLKAPLRNPLLIGMLVGIVVNVAHLDLTAPLDGLIENSLETISALAVTLMMISLGMSLAASSPRVTRRLTVVTGPRITRPTAAPGTVVVPPLAGSGSGADGGEGAIVLSEDRSDRGPILWISVAWKLVLVPLLALGLGLAMGLRGPELLVPVSTAALPSAQNVFMYATRYGAAKALARDCVLITTAGFVPVELLAAALLH